MSSPTVNRTRRAIISVAIIVYCLAFVSYVSLKPDVFPLGEIAVRGFFNLAELVVMFYIGGSVVDSTNVVGVLASRLGPSSPQATSYQPYPETEPTGVSLDSSGNPEPVEPEPTPEPKTRKKRS